MPDPQGPPLPLSAKYSELDSGTDIQLGIEGWDGTSASVDEMGRSTLVIFERQVGLLSNCM